MKKIKNILITGGSRGIGRELVKFFAKKKFNVFYTYKKNSNLKQINNPYSNIYPIKCNMENQSNIKKLIKIIKKKKLKLNILINNAGDVFQRSKFSNSSDELWRKSINLNLLSSVYLTKGLLPQIVKSKHSVIINISSISARIGGGGDSMHYGVAKAGLNAFTIGLAKELKNIRVIGIAPSIIDTDFQRKHSTKKRISKIIKQTPLGRIGNVEDVRNLVDFLVSNRSSYLSGEIIYLSGGR
tara:strand:- start:1219 stop:1941 length:723 start_codon:yes stop_codon:yes gene_type:complete